MGIISSWKLNELEAHVFAMEELKAGGTERGSYYNKMVVPKKKLKY